LGVEGDRIEVEGIKGEGVEVIHVEGGGLEVARSCDERVEGAVELS
jgi:hypothetical protein